MPPQDPSTISGNVSLDIKRFLVDPRVSFNTLGEGNLSTTFAASVVEKIVILDASVTQNSTEPSRQEAKVVCTIQVEEDMINGLESLHGAAGALFVDLCSTLAMATLQMHLNPGSPIITVSQAMNLVFHAPAPLGDELRIINISKSIGNRVVSAQTEIWSTTRHRLVVSGVHLKMTPTRPQSAVRAKM